MDFLQKLREQSEETRKIIFWAVIAITGGLLLFFWLRSFRTRIESFNTGKIHLPAFEKELEKLPEIEFPKAEIEGLKNIIEEQDLSNE